MFNEEKKPGKPGKGIARDAAGTVLKELVFQAFMWISVIVTAVIAYSIQSWWPFAGWFAVVLVFGLLMSD